VEATIKLLEKGETPVEVFAKVQSAGRNEFAAAGQAGRKPRIMFLVWAEEYAGQPEIEYNGKRLTVYRTYDARTDGRVELYTEGRSGQL